MITREIYATHMNAGLILRLCASEYGYVCEGDPCFKLLRE